MQIKGKFQSDKYGDVKGEITIYMDDLENVYTGEAYLKLVYTGKFKENNIAEMIMETVKGVDNMGYERINFRMKDFENINNTFSMSLIKIKDQLVGHYACTLPYDIGKMDLKEI